MPAPFRSRYVALALILIAGALALELAPRKRFTLSGVQVPVSSESLEPRLPELDDVDPALVARLRALEPEPVEPFGFLALKDYATIRKALEAAAPGETKAIALALLRILVEDHRDRFQYITFGSYELNDRETRPVGSAIGEFGMPELAPLLSRALAMRDYPYDFRRNIVVALCQEGIVESADVLAAIAADRSEDPDLRCYILRRIHRIGGPSPEALRDLLYQPFRSYDVYAAASLAMAGDPAGAPLLRDELRRIDGRFKLDMFVLEAVISLTGWSGRPPAIYESSDPAWVNRKMVVFQEALDEWAANRAEAPRLQRERAAYLDSDLRLRELAAHSWEELQAAGEDFDFASAALMLATPKQDRDRILESIARLSMLAEQRLRDAADPASKIRILSELVYHPRVEITATVPKIEYSFLPRVLDQEHGNCLGHSTLYLALADRVGLPLHAVAVPRHVFVRWDDGQTRINVETTDGGACKSDEDYGAESLRNQAPALMRSGAFLGNLSRRQTLGLILHNRAVALARQNKLAESENHLEKALELFAEHPALHLEFTKVIALRSLDRDEEILAHARAAFRLAPGLPWMMRGVVASLLLIGQPELAAKFADRIREEDPTPASWGLAIHARLAAGRLAEADALLKDARLASIDCSEMRLWWEYCMEPTLVDDVTRRVRSELDGPRAVHLIRFFDFILSRPSAAKREARTIIRTFAPHGDPAFHSPEPVARHAIFVTLAEAHRILGHLHEADSYLEAAQKLNVSSRQALKLERLLRQ